MRAGGHGARPGFRLGREAPNLGDAGPVNPEALPGVSRERHEGGVHATVIAVILRSTPERRRRFPARAVVVIVAVTALAVATGDVLVWRDLTRTRATIAHTHRERARARRRLHTERSDLASARAALESTQEALGGRTEERDRLRTALYLGAVDLNGTRDNLSAAQRQIDSQGARIDRLTTCLEGISHTMSQFAVNERARGLATLRSVEGACRDAAMAAPFVSAVAR